MPVSRTLLSIVELGGYPSLTPLYENTGYAVTAVVQRYPQTRVIVFYEKEHAHQLDKLRARFPLHATLPYPISAEALAACLRRPAEGQAGGCGAQL